MKLERDLASIEFRFAAVLAFASVLAACSKPPSTERFTNEQVIAELNRRLGPYPCCAEDGKPFPGERQLFVLIRRDARGEEVVCGWSGFPPVRLKDGSRRLFPPTPFIVRDRTLFLERDRAPAEFAYWQDALCGPDWVKRLGG